jgi:hypothetical protein
LEKNRAVEGCGKEFVGFYFYGHKPNEPPHIHVDRDDLSAKFWIDPVRLLDATSAQRKNWKIAGGGYGLHWPDLDEDLSTEGLLRGAPAPKAPTK